MPDKAIWYTKLEAAIELLERFPPRWVRSRGARIGARHRPPIGKNGLADREEVIRHLRCLAVGETVYSNNSAATACIDFDQLHSAVREQPRVLRIQ